MITETFELTIHGHRIHAAYIAHSAAAADRPTLVFLHDSLGCITLWRDFPQKLAQLTGCNALVYDRQGYGQSAPFSEPRTLNYLENEAHVLIRILDQCDIGSAILFGHSDGGSIALMAAAEYPQRIAGVISEAAHVFVDNLTIEGIRNAIIQYRTTNLRERIMRYHGAKTDAVFAAWTETWLSDWYRSWSIEKFLSRIQCPLLAIQGENDEFGTQAQLTTIVAHAGGSAQPCLLAGAGHTPHKEMPEVVLKISAGFIASLLPKKPAAKKRGKANPA